jgi:predicted DNA-binding transcriptional regulator AlpA
MSKDIQETTIKNNEPCYLRLKEAAELSTISVSKLHEFIADGRLRTINLKEPHQQRGIRLIEKSTLVNFLESHAEGGGRCE